LRLDWANWIYGLLFGSLGGAANAASGAIGVAIVDPKNFSIGSAHSLEVMGVVFGMTFLKDAALYLAQHPLPAIKTVITTETVEQQHHPEAQVTTTVETTETGPATTERPVAPPLPVPAAPAVPLPRKW
jgi:hypothetical protein